MPNSERPETFVINGVEITPRQLAEARQAMAHRSPFNAGFYPPFDELTEHEQTTSVLDAQNYLIALADVVPGATRPGPATDEWTWRQNAFIGVHDASADRATAAKNADRCRLANPGHDIAVVRRTVTPWVDADPDTMAARPNAGDGQ